MPLHIGIMVFEAVIVQVNYYYISTEYRVLLPQFFFFVDPNYQLHISTRVLINNEQHVKCLYVFSLFLVIGGFNPRLL